MRHMLFSIICLILVFTSCKKDEDRHSYIYFINQSEKDIIFGLRFTNFEGNCRLDGIKVMKNDAYDFRPYNFYIEDNLNSNMPLEIYIIDSDKYNEPYVFYDCDSIGIKNGILKQYSLTLDDLCKSNFTITYP